MADNNSEAGSNPRDEEWGEDVTNRGEFDTPMREYLTLDEHIALRGEESPQRKRTVSTLKAWRLRSRAGATRRTLPQLGVPYLATSSERATTTPVTSRRLKVPVGRLDSSMGAAFPGSENPIPFASDDAIFHPMEFRRGRFPTDTPTGAAKWEPAKWKAHLDFLEFNPKTEVEMERWFEDASVKIRAHGATASTTVSVLHLVARTEYRYVIQSVIPMIPRFIYIEDLADALSRRIFVGDEEIKSFESKILTPEPKTSVFTAFAAHRAVEETYTYMCRRRQRIPILQEQQLVDLAFAYLPSVVSDKVRQNNPGKVWELNDLFEYALKMESVVMRDSSRGFAAAVFQADHNPLMEDEPSSAKPKKGKCFGCGGAHLKKNCPHKRDRCAKCNKIGHTGEVCRAKIVTDTAGKARITATPTQKGATVTTGFDNTTPDQLGTIQGVMGKLLTMTEQERQRARDRYAEKKRKENPNWEKKPDIIRDVLELDFSQATEGIDEILLSPDVHDVLAVDEDEVDTPPVYKRRKYVEVELLVHGSSLKVILDSGASLDVMSQSTAKRIGVPESQMKEKVIIRDVGQNLTECVLSEPVVVSTSLNGGVVVRFALIGRETPTILSAHTLGRLSTKIDFATNTITMGSELIPCVYVVSDSGGTGEISTLQQTAHVDVEELIKRESEKWTTDMTVEEKHKGEKLLRDFKEVWFEPKAGQATTVQMEIKVNGQPRRVAARPTPVHLRSEINKQIDDLLAAGVIEQAPDCKWVSACQLVPKPRSDKWRLVIDYRYVNSLIEDDGYQIPNAQDLLLRLAGSKYYSLIDLNWGFWNVKLDEGSVQYTGFVVPERGVFIWKVMPFGLRTSPTIFQRAIEKALRDLIDQGNVAVYIDDIIIYSSSIVQHMKLVEEVLRRLKETKFYINFEKSLFFRTEALYLGHVVSQHLLKPDPAKLQGLQAARAPHDKRALLSFCAAANYLRSYIPRYSEVMEPLTALTGKYVKFHWGIEQQEAFEVAKKAIADAVYLVMPDWSKPFIIFTDASDYAVAAALAQVNKESTGIDFISFASKKLNAGQRNWSTTERELYAIVWACENYENFVKGSRPLIYTDHKSLEHLMSLNSPKARRWALRLSEYKPRVVHIKGENNNVADWLSRSSFLDEEDLPEKVYVPEVLHLVHEVEPKFKLPDPKEFMAATKEEEASMKKGTLDWYNGVAYGRKVKKIYVPERYRMQILTWFHMSKYGGHQGVTRTTNRLRKYVWWPNVHQSVADFISACPLCNAIKPLRATGGVAGALSSKPQLFQLISLDYIGPRTYNSRKVWILVMVDHYSRFMVTRVLDSIQTPAARRAVREGWVSNFGAPQAVLCDRDATFTAANFKDYIEGELGARLHYASTEYPQGNGINESAHRILETAFRTYPWRPDTEVEEVVTGATLLYNVTPNRSLGDSPASLTFGMDLHLPGLTDFEPEITEEARLLQLRNYKGARLLVEQLEEIDSLSTESSARGAKVEFKVGDIVTYRLSQAERSKAAHVSGERKYGTTRSFPQRVTKVGDKTLIVVPLWTAGKERRAPKEQCRLLTTFQPEFMREELQKLYPKLPWLEAPRNVAAKRGPRKRWRVEEEVIEGPVEKKLASTEEGKPVSVVPSEAEDSVEEVTSSHHSGEP